jgi:hypothetical protein
VSEPSKLYVVRRVAQYDQAEEGREFQRAFADREAAAAYCREATAATRRRKSPVGLLWGRMVMTGGTEHLAAAARELGLPPSPAATADGAALHRAFVAWWKSVLPHLTPELTERLWAVGRDEKLYEVVEVPLEGS